MKAVRVIARIVVALVISISFAKAALAADQPIIPSTQPSIEKGSISGSVQVTKRNGDGKAATIKLSDDTAAARP